MAAIRLALAAGEPPRMSIEEWAAMPEDEPGELVGGMLVEEEVADWYWLLHLDLHVFEVRELTADGRYAVILAAAEGRVALPGCGDLALDLDALWAELDRLGPEAGT
jgi:hypothetical protein